MSKNKVINIKNETEFNQLLSTEDYCLLDFYAQWCGPCKNLSPILEQLAENTESKWILLKIDVDHNQKIADRYDVNGIPAIFLVKNGSTVANFVGFKDKATVESFLNNNIK